MEKPQQQQQHRGFEEKKIKREATSQDLSNFMSDNVNSFGSVKDENVVVDVQIDQVSCRKRFYLSVFCITILKDIQ